MNTKETKEQNTNTNKSLLRNTKAQLVNIILRKDDIEKDIRTKFKELEKEYKELNTDYKSLYNKYDELNTDYKILCDNNVDLQHDYKDIINKQHKLIQFQKKIHLVLFILLILSVLRIFMF